MTTLTTLLRHADVSSCIIWFSGTVQEMLCKGINTPSVFLSVEEHEYYHQWYTEWLNSISRRERWLATYAKREKLKELEKCSRRVYYQRFVVRQEFFTIDDHIAKRAARQLHLRRFGVDLKHTLSLD